MTYNGETKNIEYINDSSIIKDESKNNISTQDDNHNYIYNMKQTYITISQDRVKLILIKYLEQIEKRKLWLVPLGIFISLILVVLTTDKFRAFLSIPANVWQAIIYLSVFFSICWLAYSLYNACSCDKYSIDNIVDKMKSKEEI